MADLQKMPGGAGLLKKQEAKQKTKEKGSVSSVINVQNLTSKRVHVLRCSAQLCAAAAALWKRGQKEPRAGVSPTDSLYGRSWVWVDAERWRTGAELGGGAAGGHSSLICEGRWGESLSCLLIQTSCSAGPANSPAPGHAAAASIQASRDPSCGGHHWRGHRAGGGQHDWQSLQQRHSEFRASRPSIDHRFQTSSAFSLKTTSEEEPMCFWLPPGFHLPPVPSEDSGHQDVLPERWLSGDPGAVLRTLSKEQIRGGREEGANWSGEMTETNTAHTDFPLSGHLNSHYSGTLSVIVELWLHKQQSSHLATLPGFYITC